MPNPSAAEEWATARGDKWSSQLALMEATLAPVDEPLIGALKLDAPVRIAEVGCGGGGTALQLLRHAPAGSVVHGYDISPKLIQVAASRVPPSARDHLAFQVADAATAAVNARYDRLVSRFGIMFFDDPGAAFANLARWLLPGGRFAFAVWGPPADNGWLTEVRDVVARVVELPRVAPEAPGPYRYAEPDRLLERLEPAGFTGLDVQDWRGTLPVGGGLPPGEAAQFALTAFSSFGELLARAGEEARAEAVRAVTALLSRHQQGGVVRMNALVRIVTGSAAPERR